MLVKRWQHNSFGLYLIMAMLGVGTGWFEIPVLSTMGQVTADIFIKIFKCISLPIISLSLIVTLSGYISGSMNHLIRRTAFYTFSTTIIAAAVACCLYLIIQPGNVTISENTMPVMTPPAINYWTYLSNLIPANFVAPFLENQVISVLLVSLLLGLAIRKIPDEEARDTVIKFFKGMHALFLIITKWIIVLLPLGLFGFITTTILQFHQGVNLTGIGQYLAVIVLANLIQGFVILPSWLRLKGIPPFQTMRSMMPALSVAFFSKSSAGTLPITMTTAEKNLNLDPKVSRFLLPLCTTINMNGCAAFIFTTVIYLMQNSGVDISTSTLLIWIFVATIAAIGNAGVPMGCFFLSASLLASMDVSIVLMGIILPFYSVIDMLETSLNVWSDACVVTVIERGTSKELTPAFTETSIKG